MMNIIKNSILVFIICSTSIVTSGQARGYLGKKLTLEVNTNHGFARVTEINEKYNSISGEPARKYNIYPELTLSYTVGKHTDIGFSHARDVVDVELVNLAFDTEGVAEYDPNLTITNTNTDKYDFIPTNAKNTATAHSYQFFLRFYNKRSIAPVGFYHQVAFGINRLGFKDRIIGNLESINNPNAIDIPLELKVENYNVYKLSYFFGNKKVFSNGLYINSGINFNASFISKLSELATSDGTNSSSYHYKYLQLLGFDIRRSQLMEFKLGLGFIF